MFYIFTHCNQKNGETSQTAVASSLGPVPGTGPRDEVLNKNFPTDIIFLQRAAEAFFSINRT